MPAERKELIPQPFRGEVKVQIVLPDEALRLLRDLHDDRQSLGAGFVVLLALLAAATLKYLFHKESRDGCSPIPGRTPPGRCWTGLPDVSLQGEPMNRRILLALLIGGALL